MVKTLDEWAEQYPLLVNNLRANMDQFCPDMADEEKEDFMRMNLIMIRQWGDHKT